MIGLTKLIKTIANSINKNTPTPTKPTIFIKYSPSLLTLANSMTKIIKGAKIDDRRRAVNNLNMTFFV
jgi:hypothetical protein